MNTLGAKLRRGGGFGGDVGLAEATTLCVVVFHYIPKIVEFLGYIPFDSQAKTFGEKIVNHRHLFGMTQKELAKSLGIDPSTLGRWERNEGRPQKRLQ